MERNLLVGNGINIQFGGLDVYSGSAIMNRVVENIKVGKYTALTENALSIDEQLEILNGLVKVIDQIKAGKCRSKADGLFMLMELDRIKRTYPEHSSITSVFLEDFFLAFEIFNNGFKAQDGDEQSEFYRKIGFTWLRQMLVDGIYNDGAINNVYKNYYSGVCKYLEGFSNIFTTSIGDIRDISISVPSSDLLKDDFIFPAGLMPPRTILPMRMPREPMPTFFKLAAKLP